MTHAPLPRGPMGPTRLELDKPVIAAIAGSGSRGRFRDRSVVRSARDGRIGLLRRLLPALGRAAHRRRHRALAAHRRHGRAMELILTGRKLTAEEALRIGLANTWCQTVNRGSRRGDGARDRALSAGLHARRPALGLQAAGAHRCATRCATSGRTAFRRSPPRARPAPRASPRARAVTAISAISERYRNTVPPSTMIVWPVTKRLASDAR